MTIAPLFPTLLSIVEVDKKFNSIGQEFEKCDIVERRNDFEGLKGYESKNQYLLDEEKFSEFQNYIVQSAEQYVKDILCYQNVELFMTQSWLNISHKGQKHTRHFHSNSFISGVFYWQDNITPITFVKTPIESWNGDLNPGYDYEMFNRFPDANPIREISVPKNNLILFESKLLHEVNENRSDIPRYSLAFNLFPKSLGEDKMLNRLKVFKDK